MLGRSELFGDIEIFKRSSESLYSIKCLKNGDLYYISRARWKKLMNITIGMTFKDICKTKIDLYKERVDESIKTIFDGLYSKENKFNKEIGKKIKMTRSQSDFGANSINPGLSHTPGYELSLKTGNDVQGPQQGHEFGNKLGNQETPRNMTTFNDNAITTNVNFNTTHLNNNVISNNFNTTQVNYLPTIDDRSHLKNNLSNINNINNNSSFLNSSMLVFNKNKHRNLSVDIKSNNEDNDITYNKKSLNHNQSNISMITSDNIPVNQPSQIDISQLDFHRVNQYDYPSGAGDFKPPPQVHRKDNGKQINKDPFDIVELMKLNSQINTSRSLKKLTRIPIKEKNKVPFSFDINELYVESKEVKPSKFLLLQNNSKGFSFFNKNNTPIQLIKKSFRPSFKRQGIKDFEVLKEKLKSGNTIHEQDEDEKLPTFNTQESELCDNVEAKFEESKNLNRDFLIVKDEPKKNPLRRRENLFVV